MSDQSPARPSGISQINVSVTRNRNGEVFSVSTGVVADTGEPISLDDALDKSDQVTDLVNDHLNEVFGRLLEQEAEQRANQPPAASRGQAPAPQGTASGQTASQPNQQGVDAALNGATPHATTGAWVKDDSGKWPRYYPSPDALDWRGLKDIIEAKLQAEGYNPDKFSVIDYRSKGESNVRVELSKKNAKNVIGHLNGRKVSHWVNFDHEATDWNDAVSLKETDEFSELPKTSTEMFLELRLQAGAQQQQAAPPPQQFQQDQGDAPF